MYKTLSQETHPVDFMATVIKDKLVAEVSEYYPDLQKVQAT